MTTKPPWMTPAGARAPRSRRMADDRREDLLQRLEDLILSEGFARLTVDDLASRLQCSKSTLYAVASSKDQLVTAVVRHFFRVATGRIEARVGAAGPAAERIEAYLAGVEAEMGRMSPTCFSDMVSVEWTSEIYLKNSLAVSRRLRELIQEGEASGDFPAVDADFVGAAASLLVESIQHGELLERTGLSVADAYRQLTATLLDAVRGRTAEPFPRAGPSVS